MEYTSKLLVNFLKKLVVFDKDTRSAIEAVSQVFNIRTSEEKNEWRQVQYSAEQQSKSYSLKVQSITSDFQKQMNSTISRDITDKKSIFDRLQKCKDTITLISNAENSIIQKEVYEANKRDLPQEMSLSLEDIIQGKIDFIAMAYNLNETMEADVNFIKSLKPNVIVNATGSSPLLPPISGLHENLGKEGSKVYCILDMIEHINDYPDDMTGKKVVVIGGGAVGLDVVEYFAPRGADVSIVEMMPVIGNGIDPVSKVDINTLMKKYNVKQMPNTALKEVRPDNFLVELNGEQMELPFDYGFVCLGMKAEHPVLQQIREAFEDDDSIEIVNIGDSVRARRIIDGTEEGRNILNTLRKRGYL